MRYAVVIENAGGNFSAYVPDLPGCIATGHTVEEAEHAIKAAIGFHLEGLRKNRSPLPVPTTRVDYVEVAASFDSRPPRQAADGSAVLPDVLTHGLTIVFCGTAAGNESARRRAYYAGPGNAFWPTLFKVGLTPRQLAPEEFRQVLQHGIGLTDMAKNVSGMDRDLTASDFDRDALISKIHRYSPKFLAFTSKASAKAFLEREHVPYGLLEDGLGETRMFVLPSPSGAARGYWDLGHWEELASLAKRSREVTD